MAQTALRLGQQLGLHVDCVFTRIFEGKPLRDHEAADKSTSAQRSGTFPEQVSHNILQPFL